MSARGPVLSEKAASKKAIPRGRVTVTETTRCGSYRNVRTVRVDRIDGPSCTDIMRGAPYRPPYVHDVMGERMAADLLTAGRYSMGWTDWEVSS